MEEIEIWKDIPGYEGLYQASNLGRIKSLLNRYKNTSDGLLKIIISTGGRCRVSLSKNKIIKGYSIHRLVASCFHGLDLNNPKILACHKDDNPSNNREDNLFVGTFKDNMHDMIKKGRHKFPGHPKKIILQYDLNNNLIREWIGLYNIQNLTGLSSSSIGYCCRGKLKTSGGFIWRYKN